MTIFTVAFQALDATPHKRGPRIENRKRERGEKNSTAKQAKPNAIVPQSKKKNRGDSVRFVVK
jgi:hypothetical protein